MLVSIQADVVCTIEDGFHLMSLAREVVERVKAPEDWNLYYPGTPTAALELLIRHSIAEKLLNCGGVVLHEIRHRVTSLDIPLEP